MHKIFFRRINVERFNQEIIDRKAFNFKGLSEGGIEIMRTTKLSRAEKRLAYGSARGRLAEAA